VDVGGREGGILQRSRKKRERAEGGSMTIDNWFKNLFLFLMKAENDYPRGFKVLPHWAFS